jgi:UDP-N-acetylmuramoyl-tripeptide--D-alanyl-D-alanine ligase
LESAAPFLRIGFLDEKGNMLHAQSHLVGEHNFANINTAIAIGKYFKVPARKIKEAIENYIPSMNRSQIITHASGATILLDAYNANPSSMEAALKTLSQMPHTHKIAIIGDMRELGDESQTEHELIFNYAKSLNFNQLVTVGTEFARINTEGVSFKNNEEARDWFNQQKFDSNTCILFKASRGIGLERILN